MTSPLGDPLLGRERVKQFTYDFSYPSHDPAKPDYVSQEQVRHSLRDLRAQGRQVEPTTHRFSGTRTDLTSAPLEWLQGERIPMSSKRRAEVISDKFLLVLLKHGHCRQSTSNCAAAES